MEYEQTKQTVDTLQQSWERAVARFYNETGRDLGSYKRVGKNDVLGTLEQRYGSNSKDAKKKNELYGIMEKVLNGVELVAATAAQAASVIFGPAQMCFNALDILLSIPRELKKFSEDLQNLFSEISSYLENFKVFDRIDQRGMLDIALLKSNNDILINLVEVCMLACKVIQHPMMSILSNVFLKNDAIRGAVDEFRELIEKQNKLTNTIILEATLENKAGIRQVIEGATHAQETNQDTNIMVTALAADSTESKNLKIDRDRINKIDKALDLIDSDVMKPLEELQRASHMNLGSTIALLKDTEEYKQWSTMENSRDILYISGGSGSGKTNVLSALSQQIEDERRKLHTLQAGEVKNKQQKSDRAIYLVYYSFSEVEKGSDRGKYETPVHKAFKVIACQLARQSSRYASTLASTGILDKLQKGQRTLKQLWDDLRLIQLATIAPAHSVFYLFLDGLDELKDSLKDLCSVLKVSSSKESNKVSEGALRLKVIFTGSSETKDRLGSDNVSINMPIIYMSDVNTTLIRDYIHAMMQKDNILQDDDEESKKVRDKVLDAIPASSNGSFAVATQKLQVVTEAIEEDIDADVLIQRLYVTTTEDEGKKILDHMNVKLSQQHKEQFRELAVWAVFARTRPTIDQLESALYLQSGKKSLEPLRQKIERRFDKAFELYGDYLYPRNSIEEVLKLSTDRFLVEMNNIGTSRSKKRTPNEDNGQLPIDLLVSYLRSEHPESGEKDSEVKPVDGPSTDKLSPNERFAGLTILTRLFEALNDDRVYEQARNLIPYAMRDLPSHLTEFADSIKAAAKEELKIVGKGLVNFLRDPESIEAACVLCLPSSEWINHDTIKAVKTILRDSRLQDQLEHIERRWARNHTAKDTTPASLIGIMVDTVARCWLVERPHGNSISSYECFSVINIFLYLLSTPESETFEDEKAEQTEVDESGATPQIADKEETVPAEAENPSVAADEASRPQDTKKQEPVLGKFSHSSLGIELSRTTLLASCPNIEGSYIESSINLNKCIAIDRGEMSWKLDGRALDTVLASRLVEDGKVLEILLYHQGRQVRRRLLLDEQISNDDGQLVFLNTASAVPNGPTNGDDAVDEEATLTVEAEIKRAEQWAVNTLKIELDFFALERIALTFLDAGLEDVAIEYFEKAAKEKKTSMGAVGLARAFADKARAADIAEAEKKDNLTKAIESIQVALDMYRATQETSKEKDDTQENVRDDSTPENAEVHDLFSCLLRAAEYQKELNGPTAVIDLMQEALKCRPTNSECRWDLIDLLCRADRHAQAQELFEEWNLIVDAPKVEKPKDFLLRVLTVGDSLHRRFMAVVKPMRGTKIHDTIRETIIQVIEKEDDLEKETDGVWLRYAHGMILAADGGEANLHAAENCWVEALRVGRELDFDNDGPLHWSSMLTSMHHFDRARREFHQDSGISPQASTTLLDGLAKSISEVVPRKLNEFPLTRRATGYVAALAQITGQHDYAKECLREEMASAIQILSDDDIWNDELGIQKLFEVLFSYGDYEGALSAWSLLDRDETRGKATERENIKLEESKDVSSVEVVTQAEDRSKETDQSQHTDENLAVVGKTEENTGAQNIVEVNGEGETPEEQKAGEVKSEGEKSEEEKAEDEKNPVEETYEPIKYYSLLCDNCYEYLRSYDDDAEMWWCKYCPFVVFCKSCKEKHKAGGFENYRCNPEHELFLTKHFEYTPEELKGSNVLIGWKLTTTEEDVEENGVTKKKVVRRRGPGNVVDRKEWLEILSREWNITKTDVGGVVQQ